MNGTVTTCPYCGGRIVWVERPDGKQAAYNPDLRRLHSSTCAALTPRSE